MSYDLGTAHGKITLDYDSDRAVGRAERDIDKLERKAKDGDGTLKKLGATLGSLGGAAKLGATASAMGIAAANAGSMLIQVLGIVPALASIASLSAGLPAFYAGAAAAVGVLKAAFAGVGDALKTAFDPTKAKQFDKALQSLAPNARAFVLALKDAGPQFKSIQQGIQDAFFSNNLQEFIPRVVSGLSSLRPQLNGLASDFSNLARAILSATADRDFFWDFLADAIDRVRSNVAKLTPAIGPLIRGFLDVGTVGLPLMDKLGTAVAGAAGKFGEWMQKIAASGQLQTWINTAMSTLRTLGDIIGAVFSILQNVFKAAEQTGGGLLNTIAALTGQLASFLNSSDGFETLVNIFSAVMQVAKQLAPIFLTLAGALAKALGPAIGQIAQVLGPVLLQMVQALAPAFGPLAAAIAALVTALAPLLPPIGKLVALLAGVLSTAVQGLVAAFGPLVSIIADGLLQAFTALAPATDSLGQIIPVLAEAGQQLAVAFAPLIPVIVKLATTIADSLVQVLPQLLDAAVQLIPILAQFASIIADRMISALNLLIAIIPPIVSALGTMYPILINILAAGLKVVLWLFSLGAALEGAIGSIVSFVGSLVSGLVNGLVAAYNGVVSAGAAVIGWFQALPGRIMSFLQALPGQLVNLLKFALQAGAQAVGFGIGIIVGTVTILPGKIWAALQSLPGLIGGLFRSAWNGVVSITTAGFNAVVGFFRNLPGRARSGAASLGSQISGVARSAMSSMRNAVSTGINTVITFFRNLPGRAKSAIGNIGNLLYQSGVNIINGLIRGVQSGVDRVLGMIRGLGSNIKGAFNNALSIFSPSRDFFQSGVYITQGLVNGIASRIKEVRRTAEGLANTVIQPTIALPTKAVGAARSAVSAAVSAAASRATTSLGSGGGGSTFGPYILEIEGKKLASFVIDTVTGAPHVVAAAAAEGVRLKAYVGSGRK